MSPRHAVCASDPALLGTPMDALPAPTAMSCQWSPWPTARRTSRLRASLVGARFLAGALRRAGVALRFHRAVVSKAGVSRAGNRLLASHARRKRRANAFVFKQLGSHQIGP